MKVKRDIVTKGGLYCKAGDITELVWGDPFEGSSHYTDFVTIFGTVGDWHKGCAVSVLKGDLELL